jgi:hypothetical protein
MPAASIGSESARCALTRRLVGKRYSMRTSAVNGVDPTTPTARQPAAAASFTDSSAPLLTATRRCVYILDTATLPMNADVASVRPPREIFTKVARKLRARLGSHAEDDVRTEVSLTTAPQRSRDQDRSRQESISIEFTFHYGSTPAHAALTGRRLLASRSPQTIGSLRRAFHEFTRRQVEIARAVYARRAFVRAVGAARQSRARLTLAAGAVPAPA